MSLPSGAAESEALQSRVRQAIERVNECQRPLWDLRSDTPAEERTRLEEALRQAKAECREAQHELASHFATRALALHPLQEAESYQESLREALVSLPREVYPERPDSARLLAGEPVQALWRGHTHPDPYLGGYVNGSIHMTPDTQVVQSYLGEANGTIASPLPEGFSFLTRFQPSEKLRYYGNFGWERGQSPRPLAEILPEARARNEKIREETANSPWGAGSYDILTQDLYETLGSPEETPVSGRFLVDARREDVDPRTGQRELRRGNHLRVYSIPESPEWDALLGRMAQVSQRLLALDTLALRRDTLQQVVESLSRRAKAHARGEVQDELASFEAAVAPRLERGALSEEEQARHQRLRAEHEAWRSWFQSADFSRVMAALQAEVAAAEQALEQARQAPFAPSSERDIARSRERMGTGSPVGAYFTPRQKEEAAQEFHRQLQESVMVRVETMGKLTLERPVRTQVQYGTTSPIPGAEIRASVLSAAPDDAALESSSPVSPQEGLPSLQERLLLLVDASAGSAPPVPLLRGAAPASHAPPLRRTSR